MGTLLLIIFHIVAVGAVYISGYRTGFAVSESNTRRHVEACTAPLTEMFERLNLDIDKILEDAPSSTTEASPSDGDQAQAAIPSTQRVSGQGPKNRAST